MPSKKKEKQKQKQTGSPQMTEDELLEAAIAESNAARQKSVATEAEAAKASVGRPEGKARVGTRGEEPRPQLSAARLKPAALTREAPLCRSWG